jgi:hypothetical protein
LAVMGWFTVLAEGGVAVVVWIAVGGEWEEPCCRGELCLTPLPPPLLEGGGAALMGADGAALVGVVLGFVRESEEVFAW